MRSIEVFVIFTVRTLDFAIVPGCKGLNELVANAKFLQFHLEQVRSGFIGNELFCKLSSVICLDALDLEWRSLDQMLQKDSRRIRTVFLKCF